MERRVVVTGMGTINPLAHDVETTWKKLLAGESGIDRVKNFDPEGIRCHIGGEVKDFNPEDFYIDKKLQFKMDAHQMVSFAGLKEAAMMAKIPMRHPEEHTVYDEFKDFEPCVADPYRLGVLLGIGVGGIKTFEDQVDVLRDKGGRRVNPFLIPKMIVNLAGGWIGQAVNAKGLNTTVVTACASSTNSIGEAFLAIKNDRADVIVSGGFESSACKIGFAGFANMRALSTRNDEPQKASRPFDKDRDGFIMGEGGAILVLEELEHAKKRGVPIIAEVVGYGLTADAHHITAPNPTGEGGIAAMKQAIKMAGIEPNEINYVNAHGTSTQANDKMETNAIKTLFGDHAYKLCMSSTKSMTGHLLGGAGAIEAMVIAKACQEDKVPPTINLDNPDEGFDLDYVANVMQEREVNYAMSNSFGFGGHNAIIILKKYKG